MQDTISGTEWEIVAGPAIVPDGYTFKDRETRLLDWSHVDERMRAAVNYWFATVRPNGRPHTMPTWAVWIDNRLFFDGSPETRRMRNIAANPHVAVHLEDGTQAVVLEGTAREHGRPSPEFAARLVEEYRAKYAGQGYEPTADTWDAGGLYVFEPALAIAWTEFGVDMTRWTIRRR